MKRARGEPREAWPLRQAKIASPHHSARDAAQRGGRGSASTPFCGCGAAAYGAEEVEEEEEEGRVKHPSALSSSSSHGRRLMSCQAALQVVFHVLLSYVCGGEGVGGRPAGGGGMDSTTARHHDTMEARCEWRSSASFVVWLMSRRMTRDALQRPERARQGRGRPAE